MLIVAPSMPTSIRVQLFSGHNSHYCPKRPLSNDEPRRGRSRGCCCCLSHCIIVESIPSSSLMVGVCHMSLMFWRIFSLNLCFSRSLEFQFTYKFLFEISRDHLRYRFSSPLSETKVRMHDEIYRKKCKMYFLNYL